MGSKKTKKWAYIAAAAVPLAVGLLIYNALDDMPPFPPGYRDNGTNVPIVLPKAFAVVPGQGLSFTDVERLPEDTLLLAWNRWTNVTVSSGPTPGGPWSAVLMATGTTAVVPLLASNRFYRLSQSSLTVDRQWIGGGAGPFVGNNEIAFLIHDFPWWGGPDYLLTLTNGVLSGFPLMAEGMPTCAPLSAAIDTANWRYWTGESECLHGGLTGPYTVREWQLVGSGGYFTNAVPLNSHSFGQFGDDWGSMMRLQSGALVCCYKSPASNYCFAYRSPAGEWQPIWCETQTTQASSTMELGQHPDGTIYCLVTRDGYHWIPVMIFHEANGQLVYERTLQATIEQEGEWSKVIIVPDHQHYRLLASRVVKPFHAFQWGDGILTIKGGAFQSAQIYNQWDIVEGPRRPHGAEGWSYTNHIPEIVMLNSTEVVSGHADTLSNGKLWVIFQEYNPTRGNFSLVYAQPWDDNGWGDRFFLYEAPWSDNHRGYAVNWLMSYRNVDPNPNRILFTNTDENGETTIFELR